MNYKQRDKLERKDNLVAVTIVLIALNAGDKSWKQTNYVWLVSALKLKGIFTVYTFSRMKRTIGKSFWWFSTRFGYLEILATVVSGREYMVKHATVDANPWKLGYKHLKVLKVATKCIFVSKQKSIKLNREHKMLQYQICKL